MSTDAVTFDKARLDALHLMPGWQRVRPSVWASPQPTFLPHVWRFADARAGLDEVGNSVSTESAELAPILAERRNFIMVNPTEGNVYATSRNLVAAYQMILPGELARTHRHSPSALRIALDVSPGTYTVVEGIRIEMASNDVVLTPNWCWHGHGNDSDAAGYWIDVLDVPYVQHIEAMFMEWHPEGYEEVRGADPASPFRLRPGELAAGFQEGAVDVGEGIIPTTSFQFVRIPAGKSVPTSKTTANRIFVVLEGSARVVVGDGVVDTVLEHGDLVTVPCWYDHHFEAVEDTLLVRVSDEPLYTATGYLRTAP